MHMVNDGESGSPIPVCGAKHLAHYMTFKPIKVKITHIKKRQKVEVNKKGILTILN